MPLASDNLARQSSPQVQPDHHPDRRSQPTLIVALQRMLGWYGNWLARTPDGWRIRKMVQHIDWNEGNWWIFLKAAGKAG